MNTSTLNNRFLRAVRLIEDAEGKAGQSFGITIDYLDNNNTQPITLTYRWNPILCQFVSHTKQGTPRAIRSEDV